MNTDNTRPNGEPAAEELSSEQGKDQAVDTLAEPAELEALRKRASERDQFLDLLQRTRADFENYQKRNQKDREQERRYMYSSLLFDLLPILDNLERAIAAAQQAGEKGPLAEGVGMVKGQFLELLKRYGVMPIEAQDKPFDPHLHQAVMQQPVADKPANTVVQVLERGYTHQDRVLRPARVVVSKETEANHKE
jgi:molecular chaperone GrpE